MQDLGSQGLLSLRYIVFQLINIPIYEVTHQNTCKRIACNSQREGSRGSPSSTPPTYTTASRPSRRTIINDRISITYLRIHLLIRPFFISLELSWCSRALASFTRYLSWSLETISISIYLHEFNKTAQTATRPVQSGQLGKFHLLFEKYQDFNELDAIGDKQFIKISLALTRCLKEYQIPWVVCTQDRKEAEGSIMNGLFLSNKSVFSQIYLINPINRSFSDACIILPLQIRFFSAEICNT